jgi:hypothetical protein
VQFERVGNWGGQGDCCLPGPLSAHGCCFWTFWSMKKEKKKNLFWTEKIFWDDYYQGFFVLKQRILNPVRIAMGDFHVSQEKCRVGLMTFADGVKSSFKLNTSLVFKKLLRVGGIPY